MIYVSPSEVIGAGEVIEFVAKIAVIIDPCKVENEAEEGYGYDARPIELVAV